MVVRMSIYAEKQTQDAQVFIHSQKQFAIHIFENHSVAVPCSLRKALWSGLEILL